MDKKVSIITPCLNGEKFVEMYLDSILNQSYKNIELIFVNDGSTDKTEDIVKSYINKFEDRGMALKYFYQDNAGQAAALNNGLKYFTGEYLAWLDADDFIPTNSILRKVEFLEKNKEYGMVRTTANVYNEDNLEEIVSKIDYDKNESENIFEGLLTERVSCTNGRYMLRSSCFLDVNPKREIYKSRAGQNWQMLIPIAYKYKCGYIDEPLFNYVVRMDSHSHSDENISEEVTLKKLENHQDILLNILNEMFGKKSKYDDIVYSKYSRKRMRVAYEYNDKELLRKEFKILKNIGELNDEDKSIYIKGNIGILRFTDKLILNLKIRIKKFYSNNKNR